jgi:hypothetical protein
MKRTLSIVEVNDMRQMCVHLTVKLFSEYFGEQHALIVCLHVDICA